MVTIHERTIQALAIVTVFMTVPNLFFGNIKKCVLTIFPETWSRGDIYGIIHYIYIPAAFHVQIFHNISIYILAHNRLLFKVIAMKPSNNISLIRYVSGKPPRSTLRSNLGAGYSTWKIRKHYLLFTKTNEQAWVYAVRNKDLSV